MGTVSPSNGKEEPELFLRILKIVGLVLWSLPLSLFAPRLLRYARSHPEKVQRGLGFMRRILGGWVPRIQALR